MQAKTINAESGETRKVTNEWASFAEERGSSVASSEWSVSGGLALGATTLSGSTATALVAVTGSGIVENTVTFANGETLTAWRKVEA